MAGEEKNNTKIYNKVCLQNLECTVFLTFDNILFGRRLVFVRAAAGLEREVRVTLAEVVGLLQGLGQLGAHRLGEQGDGDRAHEADQEHHDVGVAGVNVAGCDGVGPPNTDHLRNEGAQTDP